MAAPRDDRHSHLLQAFDLAPGSAPAVHRAVPAVHVAVISRHDIVARVSVTEARVVTLAERSDRADLRVDVDLPAELIVVAVRRENGAEAVIPREAAAVVHRASGFIDTAPPTVESHWPGYAARIIELEPGDRAAWTIGPLTLVASYVDGSDALPRPAVDWSFPRTFALVALVLTSVLVASALSPPSPPPSPTNLIMPTFTGAPGPEHESMRARPKGFAKHASKAESLSHTRTQRERDRKVAMNTGLLGILKRQAPGARPGGELRDRSVANASWVGGRVRVRDDLVSTFAVDVDTAAYSIARRSLIAGFLPVPSLVRVEEFINFFRYDYDPPNGADFSIQLDGARSPVDGRRHLLRVGLEARTVDERTRMPANLVFLVDTSCSMYSDDKIGFAVQALEIAVDHLTPADRVAITTYAGGVSLVLPPTAANRSGEIKAALQSLRISGGTAMEDGLTLAYQQAASMLRPGTISRIIVCSDGDANIGATSPEALLARVRGYVSEGVRLSTIGFGTGNYRDQMMEQLANDGNGNYFYIDSPRQAERVFGLGFDGMIQDVSQDVKIQVEFDADAVHDYRLVGYENRDIADEDFRDDRVDAGEIGSGHQVTAIYELTLRPDAKPGNQLATVRVRSKRRLGEPASETSRRVTVARVARPIDRAPEDLRFAVAVMGAAELLRNSPYAEAWSFDRVLNLLADSKNTDPDREELVALVQSARAASAVPPAKLSSIVPE
ncbi:MAG: von Willebrand factor type A domain-containing protein [Deltaproteobacteria bacterium]|nr:von Willebrand factor type A domain-containing protein [Deltaproteobacteria bacterium]